MPTRTTPSRSRPVRWHVRQPGFRLYGEDERKMGYGVRTGGMT